MPELTFEDFKKMADDQKLSRIEKIGFPDSYRKNMERNIADDIFAKTGLKSRENQVIVDIGCGCSELVLVIIEECAIHHHNLVLIDSEEMLRHIPDRPHIIKIPGRFPDVMPQLEKYVNKVDAIICYSVLHYIFAELNYISVLHQAVSLLGHDGRLLIGDIQNVSKRRRFIASAAGQEFIKNAPSSPVKGSIAQEDEEVKIDDSVVFAILLRFRNYGYETYLLPQASGLPMSNRREDILIVKR